MTSERITARDIQNQELHRRFRGYDPEEVRMALETAAAAVERLELEKGQLLEEIGRLKAERDAIRERETALQDTLVSAQRMASDFREKSEAEAELMLKEARHKADRILQQAREQVEKIHDDRRQARLDRDAFERGLRGLIEEHLHLLELRIGDRDEPDNVHVFRTASGSDAG